MRILLGRGLGSLLLAVGMLACEPGGDEGGPPASSAATAEIAEGTAEAPAGDARLVGIEIGRSLNPDDSMRDATRLFLPTNVPHVSILLAGTGPQANVAVRWTREDGVVLERMSRAVALSGRAAAGFKLEQRDGWPLGKYVVEVLVNGVPAGTKEFEVRQPPLTGPR